MAEPNDKSSKSDYFRPVKRRMSTGNGPNGRTGMWAALFITVVINVAVGAFYLGQYSSEIRGMDSKFAAEIRNIQARLSTIPREIPPGTVTTTLAQHELRIERLERKCDDRWDSGSWDYDGGGGK